MHSGRKSEVRYICTSMPNLFRSLKTDVQIELHQQTNDNKTNHRARKTSPIYPPPRPTHRPLLFLPLVLFLIFLFVARSRASLPKRPVPELAPSSGSCSNSDAPVKVLTKEDLKQREEERALLKTNTEEFVKKWEAERAAGVEAGKEEIAMQVSKTHYPNNSRAGGCAFIFETSLCIRILFPSRMLACLILTCC